MEGKWSGEGHSWDLESVKRTVSLSQHPGPSVSMNLRVHMYQIDVFL